MNYSSSFHSGFRLIFRCCHISGLVALTLLVSRLGAFPVNITWHTPVSGQFEDDSNWSFVTHPRPTTNGIASFWQDGSYTVSFNSSPSNLRLQVTSGDVNFALNGNTYTLVDADFGPESIEVGTGGSSASLTLSNGVVRSFDVRLGQQWGNSFGRLNVTGPSTDLEARYISLGSGSPAELNITGGGYVLASSISMGSGGVLSQGHLNISGTNSILSLRESAVMVVGANRHGELRITGGGTLFAAQGFNPDPEVMRHVGLIGQSAGSFGLVEVRGPGSSFNFADGILRVGNQGEGSLRVLNGGSLSAGSVIVGTNGSVNLLGEGNVLVRGSSLSANQLVVGDGSLRARMTVDQGSSILTDSIAVRNARNNEGLANLLRISGAGTLVQSSSDIVLSGTASNLGSSLVIIENGAEVRTDLLIINNPKARMTVTGQNTTFVAFGSAAIGNGPVATTLEISNGANFLSHGNVMIGQYENRQATVRVSDPTTQLGANGGFILGANSGVGKLVILNSAQVYSGGNFTINSGSEVLLEVSGLSNRLEVGGSHVSRNLINNGVIRLTTTPDLVAGNYQPIYVSGDWLGSGTVEAIGGVWNHATRELVVVAPVEATAGNPVEVDPTQSQRVRISSGERSVTVALDSAATSGNTDPLTFSATVEEVDFINEFEVYGAWNFTTNLQEGHSVLLSMDLGDGIVATSLRVYHRTNNGNWTFHTSDVFYDNGIVSFYADGFSSYAVVVPEPAAFALLLALAVICGRVFYRIRAKS